MLGRSAYPDPAVLYKIPPSREPVGEVRLLLTRWADSTSSR